MQRYCFSKIRGIEWGKLSEIRELRLNNKDYSVVNFGRDDSPFFIIIWRLYLFVLLDFQYCILRKLSYIKCWIYSSSSLGFPFMIACCCGPLFWRFNYSTSIMNILLRKTTSNNSIFANGESWVNIRMAGLIFLSSFWVIRKCVCHTKYGFLWQKTLIYPTISMISYTYFADFYIFAQSFIIKSSAWKK